MIQQINIPLGVLKHIVKDLDTKLEKVNIISLRICRHHDEITVRSSEGIVATYDICDIKYPMMEPVEDPTALR